MSKNDDRLFTHPNLGREVRVELRGKEVHLIFVCSSRENAESATEALLDQLKSGMLHVTLAGKPTTVEEM